MEITFDEHGLSSEAREYLDSKFTFYKETKLLENFQKFKILSYSKDGVLADYSEEVHTYFALKSYDRFIIRGLKTINMFPEFPRRVLQWLYYTSFQLIDIRELVRSSLIELMEVQHRVNIDDSGIIYILKELKNWSKGYPNYPEWNGKSCYEFITGNEKIHFDIYKRAQLTTYFGYVTKEEVLLRRKVEKQLEFEKAEKEYQDYLSSNIESKRFKIIKFINALPENKILYNSIEDIQNVEHENTTQYRIEWRGTKLELVTLYDCLFGFKRKQKDIAILLSMHFKKLDGEPIKVSEATISTYNRNKKNHCLSPLSNELIAKAEEIF